MVNIPVLMIPDLYSCLFYQRSIRQFLQVSGVLVKKMVSHKNHATFWNINILNPRVEVWFRWFSFSSGWFLGSMFIFRGVMPKNSLQKLEILSQRTSVFQDDVIHISFWTNQKSPFEQWSVIRDNRFLWVLFEKGMNAYNTVPLIGLFLNSSSLHVKKKQSRIPCMKHVTFFCWVFSY